jgi:hypothetical protein
MVYLCVSVMDSDATIRSDQEVAPLLEEGDGLIDPNARGADQRRQITLRQGQGYEGAITGGGLTVLPGEGQHLGGDPPRDIHGCYRSQVRVSKPEPPRQHVCEVKRHGRQLLYACPKGPAIHQQKIRLLQRYHVCRPSLAVGKTHLADQLASSQSGEDYLGTVGPGHVYLYAAF